MDADIASITSSPSFKLHKATAMVDRLADDYLEGAHGIRYAPFLVLLMVRIIGPTSQRSIAGALDVTRASITQRVGALVERGLLAVRPDPDDSRANLVTLTDHGLELVTRAWKGLERHQSGLDDGLDEIALGRQLDVIIANGERILKP
jgi:DNA-binding MarR family transcriptional regulator